MLMNVKTLFCLILKGCTEMSKSKKMSLSKDVTQYAELLRNIELFEDEKLV